MISIVNIINAINTKIENEFGYKPTSKDISEGFDRPSFYCDTDNYKSSNLNTDLREKNLTITIYYFSEEIYNNRIELIGVTERLEKIFLSQLAINEHTATISEINAKVVDKILQFSFELSIIEDIEIDETNIENIEELIMILE